MVRRWLVIGIVVASTVLFGCRSDDGAAARVTTPPPVTVTTVAPTTAAVTAASVAETETETESASAADAPDVTVAAPDTSQAAPRCAATPPIGVSEIIVTGGGADHPVRVLVPSSFDGTALPTVLNWHGLGSNGDEQAAYSGYEALAEEQGFMVVHPTGVGTGSAGVRSWQLADEASGDRDDVAFAATLIDELVAGWCADATRVYSTGMSNGGYFTTRLLCELSDRIAAGVSVAGLYRPAHCAPGRPVPLVAFHGTDDRVVPYEGGESVLSGEGVPAALAALFGQSIRDEFEEFVVGNGCDLAATDTFIDSEIVIHSYGSCGGGFAMALFEVRLGGHSWPGSPLRDVVGDGLGFTTGLVEATRDGWVFMREFSVP